MRYHLNLASEPFRRDRAVTVFAGIASVLLLGTLTLLGLLIYNERQAKSDLLESQAQLEKQSAGMAQQQARLEGTLRNADNADVLERSVFLNTLIARKGISWSKLFADLEKVMPGPVRLVQVRPQADSQNQIRLDMVVGSPSGEPVIELLKRMENSVSFAAPTVNSWQPPTDSEPLYRYRVSVNYVQKF